MYRNFIFVAFFLLPVFYLFAQERPPIEIYSPKTYNAENQNWGISQSKEKDIYVANNKGLLEFNGANWKLYPSPNETIIRSVNVIDDLIFTGCYREFGFWKKNEFGNLNYTSLSQKLNIPFLDDEEIWNIISIDEWILFQSLKRIYIYNTKQATYSIIESNTTLYKIFKVNNTIYFQRTKDGIYKIENGKSILVSNDIAVRENLLVNMFELNGNILIETEDNGFFMLEDGLLKKWDVPANETIEKTSVYRSLKLRDGSFILGTISDGIIHLLPDGTIDYQLNQNNGLGNNTVQSVFEDVDNNIWLGLNNGINCINVTSPFRVYKNEDGKIGTVYASIIYHNNLYLGTNQGLFFKPLGSTSDFKFVGGTQGQVWSLFKYDDTLFCGHNVGTFIVKNDVAERISDIEGTWNIIPIEENKNQLLQGNYDGLYVLEKQNDSWHLKNKIQGFDISSKFFEKIGNNILVSHEYKGVFKIEIDNDLTKAVKVVKDTSVEKALTSSLIKYHNDIYYAYKKGVFKYNTEKQIFTKDTLLSNLIKNEEYSSGKLVYDKETNKLWSFSAKDLNYIAPGKLSNIPKVNKISYPEALPKGLTGYENITHLNNQVFLIGTASGYILIDLDKIQDKSFNVNINSITVSDLNSNYQDVSLFETNTFKNNYNNIDFTFSVAEFDKYLDTEYQYQLAGIDNHWSTWSKNASVSFKYLPYGDYVFNVRAKTGNKISNNIATYSFNIKRPWLLSNAMITVYIFLFWLFSLIIHNIYKRYYKKQREKLLLKTKQELELKELENQKQLMKFNNDKLRQDIENKNRELGIATMSLIKKNEFLNNIKKEIKSQDNVKNLKNVVKIIDQNLNNTDDWNLFEEAFNNADKDFLKKVKTLHPSLTSNDLRLCAYLRLNLSSKEIAPLLNISSRSVEVKRYRLRKKMGLAHDSSLTDYILEI
jgi:DNA-binding CsgD family transcriptional regulator